MEGQAMKPDAYSLLIRKKHRRLKKMEKKDEL